MTPLVVALVVFGVLVLVAFVSVAVVASRRAALLAVSSLSRTVEAAILAETQKRKEELTSATAKEIAAVPLQTDAELEAEINK